ncbi:aminotransferase class V-fold PLP-dependent enzyme [Denitrobaculum tricleocarpae]|uniref:Cysteine desulfurase n=1 Tax=Denitrobaculum tricleocarpae TaxID=2591009 RepID=A0A545TPF4_9PROT|nr:cysteine desulfurase [Denitrobaculum tricleocarpae]TQV79051.1 cysteine desulfurase [Denitrobaculum tricleocarpae]
MSSATLASREADVATSIGDNSIASYDVEKVRKDFPILSQEVYGKPLVYLDNAASAQKPKVVIDAMCQNMETYYSNVHRGLHRLSQLSTDAFEAAREKAADFINAETSDEIVFLRGATEAINLVAWSYGRTFLKAGDEVLISEMEHHANIVPWQMLRDETGIELKVVPIDDDGNLSLETFSDCLSAKTRLVAITHISNALGTIVPLKDIIRLSHAAGAKVLVDGCQAGPHMKIDVRDLDVDFYCFSSHKVYGPTGIGVLYGKLDLLNAMPPHHGGGEMIDRVTFEMSTYKDAPHRFEPGTPAIIEAIGFGAAIDYVKALGQDRISAHEQGLTAYATERMLEIEGLRIIGQAQEKASIVSFVMDNAHAHDIGTIIDRAGVAVRAGHHCAQPLMDRFGVSATARASFGLYNTRAEVDALVAALHKVKELLG